MTEQTELLRRAIFSGRRRQDAINFPLLPASRALVGFGWCLSMILLGIFAVLVFAGFREVESGRGVVETLPGAIQITAPGSARISAIHVEQGQLVRSGQVLASLEADRFDATGKKQARQDSDLVQQRQLGLMRELKLADDTAELQLQQLSSALLFENRQFARNEVELALLSKQLELARAALQDSEQLARNNGLARHDVDRQRLQVLSLKREQQQLLADRLRIQKRQAELAIEKQTGELRGHQQKLRLQQKLESSEQELRQIAYDSSSTLVASAPGRVASITMTAGQHIVAGQTLFVIRPEQARFIGQVFVSPGIASRLDTGQSVMLRFDAWDYRHYGRFHARVALVTEEALDPRQFLLPIPGLQGPAVRVQVALPVENFSGLPRPLSAGDSFTADFVFDERSLLSYLMRPLLNLRGRWV